MAMKTTMFFLLLIMLPVATEAKKPVKSQSNINIMYICIQHSH